MRRVVFPCLLGMVLTCAAVSPGWAMPRFGRPGTYVVDGSPVGVRAAAIDSQAARDLLTANEAGEQGPSLSFLINRGLGSFASRWNQSGAFDRYGRALATPPLSIAQIADRAGLDGRITPRHPGQSPMSQAGQVVAD